jgi:fructose-specific phosphotransferase system IIC component
MLTEIMRQRAAAEHFPPLGYFLPANLRAQSAKQDSAEAKNEAQLA